jgi:hypothetical protein
MTNETKMRLGIFITFRGIFDALELDRPLLEVKVCMDYTFGSILAVLLPCLHCQLLPLRQQQPLIKRLLRAKTRNSFGQLHLSLWRLCQPLLFSKHHPGRNERCLHHTSSCKGISLTTLMLPHWQQSLALVQHTSSSRANRRWCAAAFSVSSAASLVRCMPPKPFSLCQRRQACTRVLQQSSLALHATMTTSMFVDCSCFHQATSRMR